MNRDHQSPHLYINEAGAKSEEVKVEADDGEEVIVIVAITVSVEVCAILTPYSISEAVLLEFLCHSVGSAGELNDLCLPGHLRELEEDVAWESIGSHLLCLMQGRKDLKEARGN